MLFLALLISVALSGGSELRYEGLTAGFDDVADARLACQGLAGGMDLCSKNQLFQVVFGTGVYGQEKNENGDTQMCLSAFTADGTVGWWNEDAAHCSGYGWKGFARAAPGAHCCSTEMPAPTPVTCRQSASSCGENRILGEVNLDKYCADGSCSDEFCCVDFTPAKVYTHTGGQYDYADGDAATDACAALHPDYQLCTKTQIISAYDNGYGEPVCTSGWHMDDQADTPAFARGWYNTEETVANNFCGGRTGWRGWAPPTGGSAHCCVASYVRVDYWAFGNQNGVDMATRQEGARASCDNKNGYPYTLCTQRQMQQVVFSGEASAQNICMSGLLENPLAEDAGDSTCGWEQASTDCGNGSTGWKGWCADWAGAHCCLNYVTPWYPDYTKTDHGYDLTPENYWDSSFKTGAVANTFCTDQGYTGGVCSVEQVKHVAENQGSYGNKGCLVGWATETDGSYVSGFWGTACGKDSQWYDAWQPTPASPVAHCCNAVDGEPAIPESARAPAVQDPLVKQVSYYAYATFDAAKDQCDSATGYSVCTRDQVEYVATVGVARSDGTTQIEENLCYQGWMEDGEDGSKGWYQVSTTCGGAGKTGWRSFNGAAGLYCCLDFAAPLGPPTTTLPPPVPVYTFLGAWVYPYADAAAAQMACEDKSSAYKLCTDDQVVSLTMNGQAVTQTGFSGVEAIAELAGFTDADNSGSNTVGRYQKSKSDWNDWTSNGKAGAHCCVDELIPADSFPAETSAPETQAPTETAAPTQPTETETVAPTETQTQTQAPTETQTQSQAPQTTTSAPETSFVPYSDLPSTQQHPDGCVDRPELTPEGFEGVIQYCSTGDLIYVNGQTTCVDPNDVDSVSLIQNAFKNNWYFAHGTCENTKEYEMATDDQLFVTNHMLNNLEKDIDALESSMAGSSSDLNTYLNNWKQQVADLINQNMNNFDATTQAALQQYVQNNLQQD